ncbi:nucleic acid-binding, OB-fold protein [Artemisia annua]|uniref:Nucleic acid-binding, OB-fold protein n=1 Tax=Artemisia annua TaxID=35608 RepID=A0A2U1P2Y5_ARTAN|nr:nucleic acid-binding, OB-fold protein [Artemisia annua]
MMKIIIHQHHQMKMFQIYTLIWVTAVCLANTAMQLYNVVGAHQYQLPSSGTLGAIVFESGTNTKTDYDVVIEYRDRRPKRINKLHSSYMSLQYPLLFVYGQPGFNTKMTLRSVKGKRKRTKLSMNAYYTMAGDAIQANMEASEINHFTPILIPGKTYRILDFTCHDTDNWQQTLENRKSLGFSRFTKFDTIPDVGVPAHFFDFISYNQLPDRVVDPNDTTRTTYPVLTDYIGCYIRSGNKEKVGSPMKTQSFQRKIEIQNLNGNSIELTLWGQLAETFNKEGIDALEKPIIIAVSSCKVSRYHNNLQLSATPATYYYIDPKIPELEEYKQEFRNLFNLNPPLQVIRQPFKDKEKEKTRNRFPLARLLQQIPKTYTGVRFTSEATITGLNTSREWYYKSCDTCTFKTEKNEDVYQCKVHGPVANPVNRYNFKAYITDNTETVMVTFFSPKANDIVGIDCESLLKSLEDPYPKNFPDRITAIIGQRHIFQFHYNINNKQGPPDFVFNEILDKPDMAKTLEAKPSGSHTGVKIEVAVEFGQSSRPLTITGKQFSDVPPPPNPNDAEPEDKTTSTEKSLVSVTGHTTPPPTPGTTQTSSKASAPESTHQKTAKRELFQERPTDMKKKKKE